MTYQKLDLDGVDRILCVAAHPDDLEYGISAAVAVWTEAGIAVDYLLLTAGEAGMQRPPAEVGPLRAKEQRVACDIVGVDDLTILDFPDGHMEYGLPVRKAIAAHIRKRRPNVVVTGNYDLEVPWGLNHVDHRITGVATGDAIRDASNRWSFPELLDEGLEPWSASQFLVGSANSSNVYVDVTGDALSKGIDSLNAHEEYLADLPDHPAAEDFLPDMCRNMAEAAGLADDRHAVVFRQWQM